MPPPPAPHRQRRAPCPDIRSGDRVARRPRSPARWRFVSIGGDRCSVPPPETAVGNHRGLGSEASARSTPKRFRARRRIDGCTTPSFLDVRGVAAHVLPAWKPIVGSGTSWRCPSGRRRLSRSVGQNERPPVQGSVGVTTAPAPRVRRPRGRTRRRVVDRCRGAAGGGNTDGPTMPLHPASDRLSNAIPSAFRRAPGWDRRRSLARSWPAVRLSVAGHRPCPVIQVRRLRCHVARGGRRGESGRAQQGGPVGAISIKCPTTGKPVSTGMTLTPESFYRSVLTGNSVKCPHCGITHIWSKADAKFD